jgi:hypothetical protein
MYSYVDRWLFHVVCGVRLHSQLAWLFLAVGCVVNAWELISLVRLGKVVYFRKKIFSSSSTFDSAEWFEKKEHHVDCDGIR